MDIRHTCHISLILDVWRGQLASLPRKSLHHYQVSQTHTDLTSRQNDEQMTDRRLFTHFFCIFFSLSSFYAWQLILNFGMKGRFPFLGYWTLYSHYFCISCRSRHGTTSYQLVLISHKLRVIAVSFSPPQCEHISWWWRSEAHLFISPSKLT